MVGKLRLDSLPLQKLHRRRRQKFIQASSTRNAKHRTVLIRCYLQGFRRHAWYFRRKRRLQRHCVMSGGRCRFRFLSSESTVVPEPRRAKAPCPPALYLPDPLRTRALKAALRV